MCFRKTIEVSWISPSNRTPFHCAVAAFLVAGLTRKVLVDYLPFDPVQPSSLMGKGIYLRILCT